MLLNRLKNISIQYSLAQAFVLKNRGHYAAAKGLVRDQLKKYPHNEELGSLYKCIQMLQQVKN